MELNRQLQKKKNRFLNRIKDNLELEKITKKLGTFYDYDVKVFIVSASTSVSSEQLISEVGCDDFIQKPVYVDELFRKVGDHLELEWTYEDDSEKEYFVHVSGLVDEIREGDNVEFELTEGKKGLNAVNVKAI